MCRSARAVVGASFDVPVFNQSVSGTCRERRRRITDDRPFTQQITERPPVRTRGAGVVGFLEPRQRRDVAAPDPQEPIGKDALRVAQMTEQILHAPLVGRVAKLRLLLRQRRQSGQKSSALDRELAERIGNLTHARDISFERRRKFSRSRNANCRFHRRPSCSREAPLDCEMSALRTAPCEPRIAAVREWCRGAPCARW